MLRKFFIPFLCFCLSPCAFSAEYEDFVDHRFYPDESPANFEQRLTIADMLPDSAVVFSEGYPILWEATGVGAVAVRNGEIAAAEQNGMLYIPHDRCAGMLAPDGTTSLAVVGDYLMLSTDSENHLYYMPACAELRKTKKNGELLTFSDKVICEAGSGGRYVTDVFSGAILYSDAPEQGVAAIYATTDSCYFMDESGNVDKYDYYTGLSAATHAGGAVSAVSTYEGGFTGFTSEGFFKMNISSVGILIEYEAVPPEAKCYVAVDSLGLLCESDYEGLAAIFEKADKLLLSDREIYAMSEGSLRAYSRETVWQKELIIPYPSPKVYEKDADVYLVGVMGEIFLLRAGEEPALVEEVPTDAANTGSYMGGAVYNGSGRYIWSYAERISFDGRRAIYKHRHEGKIVYISDEGDDRNFQGCSVEWLFSHSDS